MKLLSKKSRAHILAIGPTVGGRLDGLLAALHALENLVNPSTLPHSG